MLRRLFTLASALSLLLFLATVAGWMVVKTMGHHVEWTGDSWGYSFGVWQGQLSIGLDRPNRSWNGWPAFRVYTYLGFSYSTMSEGNSVVSRQLSVPLVYPLILFGGPVLAFLMSSLRRGRKPKNICRKCGYDLRASPDRCPECGTPSGPSLKRDANRLGASR